MAVIIYKLIYLYDFKAMTTEVLYINQTDRLSSLLPLAPPYLFQLYRGVRQEILGLEINSILVFHNVYIHVCIALMRQTEQYDNM